MFSLSEFYKNIHEREMIQGPGVGGRTVGEGGGGSIQFILYNIISSL